MAKSVVGSAVSTAKMTGSSKHVRHAVFIALLPGLCIVLAMLSSRGVLTPFEAPGSYFYWLSQLASGSYGMFALLGGAVMSVVLLGKRKILFAAYGLSFTWVIYFLRSLQ